MGKDIRENETVELLRKLVATESPYFCEDAIMEQTADWFQRRGIEPLVHQYEERKVTGYRGKNIVVTMQGTAPGPHICINGHLDTVWPCSGWTKEPSGEIQEDPDQGRRLYGIGALDMKSGCAAAMKALEAFWKRFGKEGKFCGKITAAFVSVEEGPCGVGTNALIEEGFLRDVDFSIITEPSAGFTGKAFPDLCLGARGGYSVTLELTGKSAHAASPDSGISAAVDAAKLILELENVIYREDPCLGSGCMCVIGMESDGGACSIPDRATVRLFCHIVRGENESTIRSQLERVVQKAGIRSSVEIKFREGPTEGSKGFLPFTVEKTEPMVQRFMDCIEGVCGKAPTISYFNSIGDFNYIGSRLNAPAVIFGAAGANYHSSDEYVLLDTVVQTAEILYRFLVKTLEAEC